jgi:hypothetical protein
MSRSTADAIPRSVRAANAARRRPCSWVSPSAAGETDPARAAERVAAEDPAAASVPADRAPAAAAVAAPAPAHGGHFGCARSRRSSLSFRQLHASARGAGQRRASNRSSCALDIFERPSMFRSFAS